VSNKKESKENPLSVSVIDTPSRRPRNSEMYYKIINLKSKLASYNNSALSSRGEDHKSMNRTFVENTDDNANPNYNQSNLQEELSNRPVMSKINELKKKWNDVSGKNTSDITPDRSKYKK
jgi:hypothetical protein